jgi:hypothetical protein
MARIESPWTSSTVIDTARDPEFVVAEALRILSEDTEQS